MKKILLLSLCACVFISALGQTKKERKKYKIKSTTEWETINEKGTSKTIKTLYEEFDKAGRTTLHVEYEPDGTIRLKESTVYDSYGNKTEETEFDPAKKKNIKRTFRYNALKDKTEEVEYNATGGIVKKTMFTYDAAGNKTTETVVDAAGKLLKKSTFSYNSKSLKTGKQTFGNSSVPESVKKWDYVYY